MQVNNDNKRDSSTRFNGTSSLAETTDTNMNDVNSIECFTMFSLFRHNLKPY